MHALLDLVAVFLAQHWLVAITNSAMTALLGLGLLHWAGKWRVLGFSSMQLLRLRRFVSLTALYKGALYLLLGVSLRGLNHQALIYGVQLPDPSDLLGFVPTSTESVWYPTAATKEVSLLLLAISFGFLAGRVVQFVRYRRVLGTFLLLNAEVPPPRIKTLLRHAAVALSLPDRLTLPVVILEEVEHPTPLLVGVCRPYLLLSPALASFLTDAELEMAFRHELAHFRQHDQWWRWLFTWLEDVGRLNVLSSHLGVLALDLEEELCDRCSAQSPQEALALATAIRKTLSFYQNRSSSRVPPQPRSAGAGASQSPPTTSSAALRSIAAQGRHTREDAAPADLGDTDDPHALVQGHILAGPPVNGPGDASAPHRVLPALLGRHTRKWSRKSSLRRRLRGLLTLSEELSRPHLPSGPVPGRERHGATGPRHWIAATIRGSLRFGLGVLLFIILYAKFYIALILVPIR